MVSSVCTPPQMCYQTLHSYVTHTESHTHGTQILTEPSLTMIEVPLKKRKAILRVKVLRISSDKHPVVLLIII